MVTMHLGKKNTSALFAFCIQVTEYHPASWLPLPLPLSIRDPNHWSQQFCLPEGMTCIPKWTMETTGIKWIKWHKSHAEHVQMSALDSI